MTTSTSTVSTLSSTFTTLINSVMTVEKEPLNQLTEKKDTISVQQAVYSDLKTYLTDFQSAVNSLTSTNTSYSFTAQRKLSISGVLSGSTVLTASASTSAVPSQYQVSVTSLAKEHRVRSKQMQYTDEALNYSGSFYLGGNGTSAVSAFTGITDTVDACLTSSVADGQRELGNGTYSIETRNDSDAGWQFRLVDASGKSVSIRTADGTYSSGWQAIAAGEQDTGRGIKLNFGSNSNAYTAGSAQVIYQGKGTLVTLDIKDTLADVAYAINNASYAENEEVVATILDKQLILSRKSAGTGNNLVVSDTDGILSQMEIWNGSTFQHQLQAATNAVFSVNGMTITRKQNTSLTDVIQGVTLNLASDAEGNSATIDVKYDPSGEKSVLSNFMSKFNSLQTYLSGKLATIKQTDGTYKRGALAGDTMFQSLRMDIIRDVTASIANDGDYTRLSDLGISMSDSFALSITDSSKLEKALSENKTSVTKFTDSLMTRLQSRLAKFLGTGGYVTTTADALSDQLETTNDQISTMNERLTVKEQSLRTRYAEIQAQLTLLEYQQEQMSTIYGVINQYS